MLDMLEKDRVEEKDLGCRLCNKQKLVPVKKNRHEKTKAGDHYLTTTIYSLLVQIDRGQKNLNKI